MAKARKVQKCFEAFAEGREDWDISTQEAKAAGWDAFMRITKAKNLAWDGLVMAIRASPKPVEFVGADGAVRIINTVGGLVDDHTLRYSPNLDCKFCIHGYNLSAIQKFLQPIKHHDHHPS